MHKIIFIGLILFTSILHSQQLIYKSGGKILDSNNTKLSDQQVRALYANHPQILKLYNEGKSTKEIGTILIGVGAGLLIADLAVGLTTDTQFPTALTYVGATSALLSVLIKSGYAENIKKSVNEYNNLVEKNNAAVSIKRIDFIGNQHGLGLQVTF